MNLHSRFDMSRTLKTYISWKPPCTFSLVVVIITDSAKWATNEVCVKLNMRYAYTRIQLFLLNFRLAASSKILSSCGSIVSCWYLNNWMDFNGNHSNIFWFSLRHTSYAIRHTVYAHRYSLHSRMIENSNIYISEGGVRFIRLWDIEFRLPAPNVCHCWSVLLFIR